MIVMRAAWLSIAVVMPCLLGGAGGCEKACTDVGCQNQLSAAITRTDGSFPPGLHQIEVAAAGGVPVSCTFTFSAQAPPASAVTNPVCSGGLFVSVDPETICTEVRSGGGVSQRCDPVPGKWIERVSLVGTPGEIRIRQTVDGVTLLDRMMALSYRNVQPNGSGCEPICRQATETLTLP
jgi:hypothetical protein